MCQRNGSLVISVTLASIQTKIVRLEREINSNLYASEGIKKQNR